MAGLTIASDLELQELPVADARNAVDWTFEMASERPSGQLGPAGHVIQSADGEIWRELRLSGTRLLVTFPGSAEFVVSVAERRLVCAPSPEAEDNLLRHLLLDQVLPYILTVEGWLVLHASAIATPGGAVAFIGPSGAGKSSLAASFATDGFAVLSDDFLPLKQTGSGFLAAPSYPGLRLWPNSQDFFRDLGRPVGPVAAGISKGRFLIRTPPPPISLPLLAIIALTDVEAWDERAFVLHHMGPRDGFLAVFENGFRLGPLERERQLDEFNSYTRLVGTTEVLRLQYRPGFELLAPIRAEILESVCAGSR